MDKIKVKLFSERQEEEFEKQINDFILKVNVVDIKFTTTDMPRFSALILYED